MKNNNNTQEKRIFAHEIATELTEKEMKETSGGTGASFPWYPPEQQAKEVHA